MKVTRVGIGKWSNYSYFLQDLYILIKINLNLEIIRNILKYSLAQLPDFNYFKLKFGVTIKSKFVTRNFFLIKNKNVIH